MQISNLNTFIVIVELNIRQHEWIWLPIDKFS